MFSTLTVLSVACVLAWSDVSYTSPEGYQGPAGGLSAAENQKVWEQYCEGYDDLSRAPGVRYDNGLVIKAARIVSEVIDNNYSLYYYGGPLAVYGLKGDTVPADAQKAGEDAGFKMSSMAHKFMVQLCGEFRDRASIVEEKLRWVADGLFLLPTEKQKPLKAAQVKSSNIWSHVSAHSYGAYLEMSIALFRAREAEVRASGDAEMGQYSEQLPVPGTTVCDTKFMFTGYIAAGKKFDSLKKYNTNYKKFRTKGCTLPEDEDYYYDFRGDSNFKPYSPESNGMIWYTSSLSRHCASPNKAKAASKAKGWITDQQCESYYRNPFTSRFAAARAGLATWLFRSESLDSTFGDEDTSVYIHPHTNGALKPYSFSFGNSATDRYEFPKGFIENWAASVTQGQLYNVADIGYNSVVGFDKDDYNVELAFERLRDAVNRHTDWYDSGFDDGMGLSRDQAYSPFVASSYEMSASDNFTAPGTTVNAPSDGRKHWMFVFRVHKDQWYHTQSIIDSKAVDFDRNWFDETSLGTNGLANSERAWDRLGSALEGEYDSILYLHNITTGGEVEEEQE